MENFIYNDELGSIEEEELEEVPEEPELFKILSKAGYERIDISAPMDLPDGHVDDEVEKRSLKPFVQSRLSRSTFMSDEPIEAFHSDNFTGTSVVDPSLPPHPLKAYSETSSGTGLSSHSSIPLSLTVTPSKFSDHGQIPLPPSSSFHQDLGLPPMPSSMEAAMSAISSQSHFFSRMSRTKTVDYPHWSRFFKERHHIRTDDDSIFSVYVSHTKQEMEELVAHRKELFSKHPIRSPPGFPRKSPSPLLPVLFCIHGAGSSALSFAALSGELCGKCCVDECGYHTSQGKDEKVKREREKERDDIIGEDDEDSFKLGSRESVPLSEVVCVSIDLRGHGCTVTNDDRWCIGAEEGAWDIGKSAASLPRKDAPMVPDLSLETLVTDVEKVLYSIFNLDERLAKMTVSLYGSEAEYTPKYPKKYPHSLSHLSSLTSHIVLVGHSLGGSIASHLIPRSSISRVEPKSSPASPTSPMAPILSPSDHHSYTNAFSGLLLLDVSELTATAALAHLPIILRKQATTFRSMRDAVCSAVSVGHLKSRNAASISIGSMYIGVERDSSLSSISGSSTELPSRARFGSSDGVLCASRWQPAYRYIWGSDRNDNYTFKAGESQWESEAGVSGVCCPSEGKEKADKDMKRPPSFRLINRISLIHSNSVWKTWFAGMNAAFKLSECPKGFLLADIDRLDDEMSIFHMMGKCVAHVVSNSNHYVHEDNPKQTAQHIIGFLRHFDIK
ncbi:Protein phosphatase methylesterase, eukaryotic like protein [Aduncisulcus paluster]|uniref:protein phosphatase methylesterase-1 n=1 Tax=Aduncisulcus paluster TaxID=2918883 RepID=A0ABQ5KW73_9EUKA|nr:Protein phosphatase methylesterase, eukaryotic like protein [Aduncisulcus paluster]